MSFITNSQSHFDRYHHELCVRLWKWIVRGVAESSESTGISRGRGKTGALNMRCLCREGFTCRCISQSLARGETAAERKAQQEEFNKMHASKLIEDDLSLQKYLNAKPATNV